mmetsp:Transcript_20055/g.31860  ORF Transcript_20055/g.31860 Transcript_20055/m.31860 type:complete len:205 (+) Transcript_20055:477-1091(+)
MYPMLDFAVLALQTLQHLLFFAARSNQVFPPKVLIVFVEIAKDILPFRRRKVLDRRSGLLVVIATEFHDDQCGLMPLVIDRPSAHSIERVNVMVAEIVRERIKCLLADRRMRDLELLQFAVLKMQGDILVVFGERAAEPMYDVIIVMFDSEQPFVLIVSFQQFRVARNGMIEMAADRVWDDDGFVVVAAGNEGVVRTDHDGQFL